MNSRVVLRLVILAVVGLGLLYAYRQSTPGPSSIPPPVASATADETILRAFQEQRSGVWVESRGTVDRLLPDDLDGSRHQRFIIRLETGHTLLMSHNIDLAPRLSLSEGDAVGFRGKYEWNERGGVVHWTHHDPQGRQPGGWIRHRGEVYR